jgi:hypothetical protein
MVQLLYLTINRRKISFITDKIWYTGKYTFIRLLGK